MKTPSVLRSPSLLASLHSLDRNLFTGCWGLEGDPQQAWTPSHMDIK